MPKSSRSRQHIAGVDLRLNRPTRLRMDELHRWVVWQFPRQKRDSFCGAVRPPIAGHGWWPALINGRKKRVTVHANVESHFPTPEAAADWIFEQPTTPA